jgi:hypothetical protein
MDWLREGAAKVFDRLKDAWSSDGARKFVSFSLLSFFGVTLVLIELSRERLLPERLADFPQNHFVAVEWTVDFLLIFEVIDLVFALAASVSGSVGKQLEVFALILLRKSFEELKNFSEPINLSALPNPISFEEGILPIWNMAADASGALILFGLIVAYRRLLKHRPITESPEKQGRFIQTKKLLALLLLGVVLLQAGKASVELLNGSREAGFYTSIFTAFIFFDIALVLVSLRYSDEFRVVFRNFGFTTVTIFLRLAITAEPFVRATMGCLIGVYAVAIAALYIQAAQTEIGKSESE